jgi:hypothetical protein
MEKSTEKRREYENEIENEKRGECEVLRGRKKNSSRSLAVVWADRNPIQP